MIFGIDLTPLITDDSLDIADFICACIDRFNADVKSKLNTRLGKI